MATFLIIEDEKSIRIFTRVNLVVRGFEVIEAETAEAGLALLRHTKPDALLLDIVLPGMSGWDLLDRMAAEPTLRDIPVIVITASTMGTRDLAFRYPNVVDCLIKPVSVSELLQTVAQVIPSSADKGSV